MLEAQASEKSDDVETSSNQYQNVLERFPDDPDVLEQCSRFYFEQGQLAKAETVLNKILERDSSNAEALHNLGSIQLQRGNRQLARSFFEQSLEIRPDARQTLQLLASVLQWQVQEPTTR